MSHRIISDNRKNRTEYEWIADSTLDLSVDYEDLSPQVSGESSATVDKAALRKDLVLRNGNIVFKNAQEAFEYFYEEIKDNGLLFRDTRTLFNQGFILENPTDNIINTEFRSFNPTYAKAEFEWYLSGDRNLSKLGEIYGKVPKIWKMMADDNGDVNSNYGWQWNRNSQLDKVVDLLKKDIYTRRASISIYDAKEFETYFKDTPCTYAVNFYFHGGKLNMSVMMRSNDLWYGFCNDQYCFSELQKIVAERLSLEVGEYYHFANNLHLYNRDIK